MKKILIIANCRLGDSLVMIPALKALRAAYPDVRLTLVSEAAGEGYVAARDIFGGRGLVDEFISMRSPGNILLRLWERLAFFVKLRCLGPWDCGIVLMPPVPPMTMALVKRFTMYLRLCGAGRIVAPQGILEKASLSVVDLLVKLLEPLGIPLPEVGKADVSLPPLIKKEDAILSAGKHYMAVAPGANMSAKIWGWEKIAAVLKTVCPEFGLTPVYFGGSKDKELCEKLHEVVPGVKIVGRSMAQVEQAMRCCGVYLGNDTGLAHLAAAVGLPCVTVFSCRDMPGLWEPYAEKAQVLRVAGLPCEGCLLTDCNQAGHPCLAQITPEMVVEAVEKLYR